MSVTGSMTPPHSPVIGWGVAVAIFIAQFGAALYLSVLQIERMTLNALRHGAHLWWDQEGAWVPALVIAGFLPMAVVPGVFGVQTRQLFVAPPAFRWPLLAAVLAVLAVADGTFVLLGDVGGYATYQEAVWTRFGKIEARHPWREATGIDVGCRTPARRSSRYRVTYRVRFDDGRVAELQEAFRVAWAPGNNLKSWIGWVEPIDAAITDLPQARDRRFLTDVGTSRTCIEHVTGDDDPALRSRFRQLMHLE